MYVTFSLDGGGAQRLLTNLATRCDRVVSLRPGGVFRSVLEDAGVEVVDLGMTRYHHAIPGVFRLARLIRANRPEIMYGWDYFANVLVFAARFLARSRARVWCSAFGTLGQQKLKWRFRIVLRLNKLLSRHIDGMVYNGETVRDYHRAIGFRESRALVISNSIDADTFRHDVGRRESMRQELGVKPDDVVIAVVARVHEQKDWPTVCEAVRELRGVVTLAAGHGTNSLPRQPGLIALGWRDDVVSVLSAADIFLLASAFGEGTSLALGEAMLCGLPCIVTDVGDNGSLVGDAGIVVRPQDASAIRQAIIELASDPDRRRILGQQARARATASTSRRHRLNAIDVAEASL